MQAKFNIIQSAIFTELPRQVSRQGYIKVCKVQYNMYSYLPIAIISLKPADVSVAAQDST